MKELTDAGISYWIDKEGLYSGERFTEALLKFIKATPIFVFLSTANSNKSKYTSREIAIADEHGKYIIPVRIDKTPYSDKIMFRIADISYINYAANPVKGRKDLLRSIKSYLDKIKKEDLLKKEELELQRKQQEEEKKRKEEIAKIETEMSALETKRVKLEKTVLQKEQELKIAQVDLKACETAIRKLQSKLDEIRKTTKNKQNAKNVVEEYPLVVSNSKQKPSRRPPSTDNKSGYYKIILTSVGPNKNEVTACIQRGTRISAEDAEYFVAKASKMPIDLFGSYSFAEANKIKENLFSLGAIAVLKEFNT
jgi:hypothetical protein